MKTQTMSFAASLEYKPANPDRTAKRSMSWDVTFQEWPSRAAMLKTIEMQGKRAFRAGDWKAVQP